MHTSTVVTVSSQIAEKELTIVLLSFDVFYTVFESMYLFLFWSTRACVLDKYISNPFILFLVICI